METRKYFLDWLRVAAFGLLIVFHVGMLYVSWQYNLKSPRLYPAIEPLMNAVGAWRLALLFLISGVASCYLIDKLGPGAFALDRLRRLLPVILTGMYVVIPPQTYIVLVSRGATHMDFPAFWWTQYLRADQTLVRPFHMTMPTWDHIWFLVYLLIYTLVAAGTVWTARRTGARTVQPVPPAFLILGPPVWLALTNLLILTKAPITDALVNDWGGHLKWVGVFVTGLLAARQDQFWAALEAHWGKLSVAAALLLLICALCGFAKTILNHPSALLSHLTEAVLPIYVVHQPILLVTAYWLFPLGLPLPIEALLLAGATGVGSFAVYEGLIRPFPLSRFLFGLKPKTKEGGY
jgi:glucan biosynthesis protein C